MRFTNIPLFFFLVFPILNYSQDCSDPVFDSIGYAIDYSLAEYDNSVFDTYFDRDSFIAKVIPNNFKEKSINNIIEEYRIGVVENFNLGIGIVQKIENGAIYDYVKCYNDGEGKAHLLFRFYSDDGLNYNDYTIQEKEGNYYFSDIYIFLMGEYMSQTMRRLLVPVIVEKLNNEKGYSNLRDKRKKLSTTSIISKLNQQGRYEEAYHEFEKLDSLQRKEKLSMILKVKVCSKLSDSLYVEALSDFLSQFPNDPSAFLISIDHFYFKKKYKKSLAMVDSLDASIGGDLFLNLNRGEIYFAMGEMEKAKSLFHQFTEQFPYHVDGPVSLLHVYIELKEYDNGIETLDYLLNNFYSEKDVLIEFVEENFHDFYQSDLFEKWKKDE